MESLSTESSAVVPSLVRPLTPLINIPQAFKYGRSQGFFVQFQRDSNSHD